MYSGPTPEEDPAPSSDKDRTRSLIARRKRHSGRGIANRMMKKNEGLMTPGPEQDPADLSREAQRSGIIPALVPVATNEERGLAADYSVSTVSEGRDLPLDFALHRAQTARAMMELAAKRMCWACYDSFELFNNEPAGWWHRADAAPWRCRASDIWQALADHDAAVKEKGTGE